MTDDEQTVLLLKGVIASLPPDDSKKCLEFADSLRKQLREGGELANLALALVGAEITAGQ